MEIQIQIQTEMEEILTQMLGMADTAAAGSRYEQFLEFVLPKYINVQVYHGFLENSASEYAARMTAMDNASSNAGKLIDNYTLLRNRARQAAITTELTEIVSGAEALK